MSVAAAIQWELAKRRTSPFFARRHLAVVPNVSWGLIPWEADLLVLARSGYLYEIEIKATMSDWRADAGKAKWSRPEFDRMIRRFWYAVPARLAERASELRLPDFAGIVRVREAGLSRYVEIVRHPKNRNASKLNDSDQMKLLRLGCLKAWGLQHQETARTATPGYIDGARHTEETREATTA